LVNIFKIHQRQKTWYKSLLFNSSQAAVHKGLQGGT